MDFTGFMSYVQADDEHEEGRITEIRLRLSAEVKFQTGREFPIFQDIQDILVGERWRQVLHKSIDGSTFLLVIITPSFLLSQACRDEVDKFLKREEALERDDLIIPLLYFDTPGLQDPSDDIAKELLARQYDDWRSVRFEDPNSPAVRQKLAELASQIVASFERTAASPISIPAENIEADDDFEGDSPGFIELVAAAEEAMPVLSGEVAAIGGALKEVGEKLREGTAEVNAAAARGKGTVATLTVTRRLVRELGEPVAEMERAANNYVEQLIRVDGGMQALIARIPDAHDEDDITAAESLVEAVQALTESASEAMDSIEQFQEPARQSGKLSSTLRPVFKRILAASQKLLDHRQTFSKWVVGLEQAISQRESQ